MCTRQTGYYLAEKQQQQAKLPPSGVLGGERHPLKLRSTLTPLATLVRPALNLIAFLILLEESTLGRRAHTTKQREHIMLMAAELWFSIPLQS